MLRSKVTNFVLRPQCTSFITQVARANYFGSRIHSIVKNPQATTLTGPNVDNLIDKYYSLFKLTTLSDTSRHRYVLRTISQTVTCHRQDSRIQSNGVKYPFSNIFLVWVYRTISSSSYSYHPLIFDHDPVPPLHRLA